MLAVVTTHLPYLHFKKVPRISLGYRRTMLGTSRCMIIRWGCWLFEIYPRKVSK